jgi:hypothetical protein
VLDPATLFGSHEDWERQWPGIVETLDDFVLIPNPDGTIGQGASTSTKRFARSAFLRACSSTNANSSIGFTSEDSTAVSRKFASLAWLPDRDLDRRVAGP